MKLSNDNFNSNILNAKPKSILDVGSGSGRYYEWAEKHDIEYEGVDVDRELVKKAKAKYSSSAFNTFNGKDLAKYSDKSFDVVLLVEVMEHVENIETLNSLLKECIRVARYFVFFTTPNSSDEKFLVSHRLIYHHYTHSVGEGYNFKYDNPHMHHLRFTKKSLSDIVSKLSDSYIVEERVPLEIRSTREPDHVLFFKLWGVIDCRKSDRKKSLKGSRLIKKLTKNK